MSIFAEMWAIIEPFLTGETFLLRRAVKVDKTGLWLLGAILTLGGGFLIYLLYRVSPFLERYLERTVMILAYLVMALIVCVAVLRRFVFGLIEEAGRLGELNFIMQPFYELLKAYPLGWSQSIPPLMFLVLAWFACSYNVGTRSHLAFSEVRLRLPRLGQFLCLSLDAALWIVFAWVLVVTSSVVVFGTNLANESTVDGTDFKLPLWYFNVAVPLSFIFLSGRAIRTWATDLHRYLYDEELVETFKMGGDD